jgi:DNA-binding NarL/FixJ family response regulator
VAAGEAWVDLAVLQFLAGPIADRGNRELDRLLTNRERQVLEGVVEGLTNKIIAGRVGISEGTAKAVLREIFRKAGVRRRSHLVRLALTGSSELSSPPDPTC